MNFKIFKIVFGLLILLITGCSSGNQNNSSHINGAVISLKKNNFNLGVFERNDKLNYKLTIYNKGNEPLLIIKVRTNCGCTAADYDNTPIMPGDSGKILLNLSTEKTGIFAHKKVAIYTNAVNNYDTAINSSRVICEFNWEVKDKK